jgi:hypothetical protein
VIVDQNMAMHAQIEPKTRPVQELTEMLAIPGAAADPQVSNVP